MDTHTSQRPPVKVKNKAFDFMQFMRLILSGSNCDWRFIINMDQTPVYFTMNAKKTLEVIGKKTIHIRTLTSNTTVDGTLLPSTLVYKGKPNGMIEKKEFPSGVYPTTHFCKCQEAAWMDEAVMIPWVSQVLVPYAVTAPDHIILVLILDMYRCQMMALVVQMTQELNVEVKHIPEECTFLC